jgi:hypothetical protein
LILKCSSLGITNEAQVVDLDHQSIRSLYLAGKMAGGLFYFN